MKRRTLSESGERGYKCVVKGKETRIQRLGAAVTAAVWY